MCIEELRVAIIDWVIVCRDCDRGGCLTESHFIELRTRQRNSGLESEGTENRKSRSKIDPVNTSTREGASEKKERRIPVGSVHVCSIIGKPLWICRLFEKGSLSRVSIYNAVIKYAHGQDIGG